MNLVSIRLITADLDRLVAFYERVTGVDAVRHTPDFAEIHTSVGTLAIGSVRTVALFAAGSAEPAANGSAIIEFRVQDVDASYERLRAAGETLDVVAPPTTMPWGNRSLLLRDPDGSLVNLFAPVSDSARTTFAATRTS